MFAGTGVLMVGADAEYGWLVAAFGLVGSAVFAVMLLRPNRLELSEEGLMTVTLGRRWSVKWSECGEFRTSNARVALDRTGVPPGFEHISTTASGSVYCFGPCRRVHARYPADMPLLPSRTLRSGNRPAVWRSSSSGGE